MYICAFCFSFAAHVLVDENEQIPFRESKKDSEEDFRLLSEDSVQTYFDVSGEREPKQRVPCASETLFASDGVNSAARACIYRDFDEHELIV